VARYVGRNAAQGADRFHAPETDNRLCMTKDDDTTRADKKAKAAARLRKWRAGNPLTPEQKAKAVARVRKWRAANPLAANPSPEQKAKAAAKAAARMRKWRAANPPTPQQKAKAAEKSRQWPQANSERHKAYKKAWRDANRKRSDAPQNSSPQNSATNPK